MSTVLSCKNTEKRLSGYVWLEFLKKYIKRSMASFNSSSSSSLSSFSSHRQALRFALPHADIYQTIRYPFLLVDQHDRCGYPGFNLSCQGQDLILTLHHIGNFSVYQIDYTRQFMHIEYSEGCTPRILLPGRNFSDCPFLPADSRSYTFLNCSVNAPFVEHPRASKILCLSGLSFSVVAMPTIDYITPASLCWEIAKVLAPISPIEWEGDVNEGINLAWTEPDCRWCERHGGNCLFENDASLDIICSVATKTGLPKSAKYGLIFGVAIPFLCLFGVLSYSIKYSHQQHNHPNPGTQISAIARRSTSAANGLDSQTIEAYPVTLVDQSRQLPKPNDICSICLCECQAKEMSRTIPNCNHYFHVICIDEWLKLNATCPICRSKYRGFPSINSIVIIIGTIEIALML